MKLPLPEITGGIPLEHAIKNRRTIRSFSAKELSLQHLSGLLWAGQGITDAHGFKRAAPSAGALYPMDIYVVSGNKSVLNLEAGVYHYRPGPHEISGVTAGDFRSELAQAALFQTWIAAAPVNFVITAEYSRTTVKYGDRGIRYAMIEAGHIGQNIFLAAASLGIGAGIVGAFNDNRINQTLQIPRPHKPLLIMPAGYKN